MDFGTLVVLGDSLGDCGGCGPSYADVLADALRARTPSLRFVNEAVSGSRSPALDAQIRRVPKGLPGPVVVSVTSGGNDLIAAIPAILTGDDAPIRARVAANVGAAVRRLRDPTTLGLDAPPIVVVGNYFDPSDGRGVTRGCFFSAWAPPMPDGMFDAWNAALRRAVVDAGGVINDLHARFTHHGIDAREPWLVNDCIHPNTKGHAAIAAGVLAAIGAVDRDGARAA